MTEWLLRAKGEHIPGTSARESALYIVWSKAHQSRCFLFFEKANRAVEALTNGRL